MSLLPAYMSKLWKCYEQMHKEDMKHIDITLLSLDPLECHISVLPFLAWEADVDISVANELTAREMIAAASRSAIYAGSVASLKENIVALSDDTIVSEWFEYDANPYHFKTHTFISDYNKIFGKELFAKMEVTVKKYKNVRSVFDGVDVSLKEALCNIEMAGAGTLSAKLANELSLDYDSFGAIDVAGANAINIKLKSDFKQDDKQIALNLTGGGVMDVKISKMIEVVYPQTDINIQGVGIWTI